MAATKFHAKLIPVNFLDIEGWEEEDHLAALSCFRVSARRMAERPYSTKLMGIDAERLSLAAKAALDIDLTGRRSGNEARDFFENWFEPNKIVPTRNEDNGFVTGYFEPEINASPVKTDRFMFPILKRPVDLVTVDDKTRPDNLDPSFFFAKDVDGELIEYEDRKAIENGALDGLGLELFWFESRIEIFFIHIQGSARLIMPDGSVKRISYAGKTGHPFTAIGKLLIERGELTKENVTMQTIRAWLENHRKKADALMQENRSYIFFQEIDHPDPDLGPVAAAGVALTPGRSLAIDHRVQTFGTPIWVRTKKPLYGNASPFARLMFAQDTGSAIVGPARGDLFIGTGFEAGEIAGRIKHEAEFIVLRPRETAR